MVETGKYTVSLGDQSQGTVIGDGNIVYQHYYASPIEAPTPVAPSPPSGFVGHDEVLGQLSSLLQSSTHPASVGLWGMAGVGKSALAKALVQRIAERFLDGCLWGDARRAQGDARTILEGFAWSLGLDPRMCSSFSSLQDRVRLLLRNRRMLFVLDNASTQSEADAVSEVADPGQSVVLVTTRSRELAVDLAETANEVVPLAPREAEQLLRYHSQLTADVDLNELVTRTAGIPLLIEAVGRQICRARPERKSDVISRLEHELLSPAHQLALAAADIAYRDVLAYLFTGSCVPGGKR
jgi:hypothetical protein